MASEKTFEELFEDSLVQIQSGSIVDGTVSSITGNSVIVDLGFKSAGILPTSDFADDTINDVKIGDKISAYVVRVNDGEGYVLLSKKRVDGIKMWENIDNLIENKENISVKVTDEVGAGLLADKNGIRVFIPASQLAEKNANLKSYVGRNLNVRFLEVNKDRRRVVASERAIVAEERKNKQNEVWNTIKEGQEIKGEVRKLEKFGAFVDLGGVDGLVHISELSWGKIKHPSEVLRVGDIVTVNVLSVDKENKKISLGYKKAEDNPWTNIEENYKIGEEVTGKVVSIMPFGAFVEIQKGLEGLLHISQICEKRINTPAEVLKDGQTVTARIIKIESDKKRLELSMREEKAEADKIEEVTKKEVSPLEEKQLNEETEIEIAEVVETEINPTVKEEKVEE